MTWNIEVALRRRVVVTERTNRLLAAARFAVRQQHIAGVLRREGKLRYLADDPDCPDLMRLAAVVEETGEVARALHDNDREGLQAELAQLAGIALAWMAYLQGRGDHEPA